MRPRRLGGTLAAAILLGIAGCFSDPLLGDFGPYAVFEIFSTEGVTPAVTTPRSRTVEVVASLEYDCDPSEVVHSLSGSGRELTLLMEVKPQLCRRGGPPFRTYRATIADVSRGALRLRVVHRLPRIPALSDTVVNVQLDVP